MAIPLGIYPIFRQTQIVVLNYHGFFHWAEESPCRLAKLKETLAEAAPAREERASKVGLVAVDVSRKNNRKGILSGKNIERSGRIEILINQNLELHSLFFGNLLHIAGKNDDFNQQKEGGWGFFQQ